ncbi:hypothetical protein D3C87_796800 [compost metagenome]
MSDQGSHMLVIAGASVAAVALALCLMRTIRTDHVRARQVYRIIFAALVALLAPTLIAAGHGVLPVPFVTVIPVLAYNLTSLSELELLGLGLLGLGTGPGTGQIVVFTLPSLALFALMLFVPLSLPRSRQAPAGAGASTPTESSDGQA